MSRTCTSVPLPLNLELRKDLLQVFHLLLRQKYLLRVLRNSCLRRSSWDWNDLWDPVSAAHCSNPSESNLSRSYTLLPCNGLDMFHKFDVLLEHTGLKTREVSAKVVLWKVLESANLSGLDILSVNAS